MKKQFSTRKLISRLLMVPLIAAGIGFSVLTFSKVNEQSLLESNTLSSSDTKASDSSYVDPEDVIYRVNKPNPMSFDNDANATFDFLAEQNGGSWTEFPGNLMEFDIVFEEANTTYGDNILAKIEMDSKNFGDYFTTTASPTASTATYTSKPLNLIAEAGYNFIENEEYQFRLYWEGIDVGRVSQYTEPVNFIYGVSAPVISYQSYFGYEQAVVEADVLLYGALLDAYTNDPFLDTIYTKFQATWENQVNQEMVNLSNADAAADLIAGQSVIIDTRNSTNTIKLYFLFDNLKDGEEIGVDIHYFLSPDFGYLEGDSSYSVKFVSETYDAPELQPIDPSKITVNTFDELSKIEMYGLYGGVTVPFVMNWVDKGFPTGWASIDTEFESAGFTPEVTFKRIIDSVKINSIKTTGITGGEVDPSTVSLVDGTASEDKNWNTVDPENVFKETDLYFENLELGQTYEVDFTIKLANPDMFEGQTEFITNKVTFETPGTIETPKINITDITVPTDETGAIINDPTNWTELSVTFNIGKPASWTDAGVNNTIKVSDIFDSFEILAMEGTMDETTGEIIYDESTAIVKKVSVAEVAFDTDNVQTISGLNSEHEYGLMVNGIVNDTFARIFGIDEEDKNVSSTIVSSNTRNKSSLPSITANTDLHDIYEPEETGETEYTYGFYIDDPLDGSWSFELDEANSSSAYYFKNIINNIYVTNVYSTSDMSSSEAQSLYAKKFYVNNATPGNSSASTNLDSLYINNATNTVDNANSITIDGLKTTWNYTGKLVVELKTDATDAAQGWLDTDTNSINIDFSFAPGHPIKAPTVTVDSIDTEQTTYDRHTAYVNGTIDISKITVPSSAVDSTGAQKSNRAYFEEDVLPDAKILSEIWLEYESEVYSQLSPQAWEDVLPSFEDITINPDATNNYDPTTKQYHFTLEFSNLTGNSDYDLFISNSEDFGFIEDVLDTTATFTTEYNETLGQSDLSFYVTNYEFGNQNEATNLYEDVQVNLNQVVATVIEDYPEYYDDLSKNITSLEIVDTVNRNVVATFDPATISDLTVDLDADGNPTGFGDISASLVSPLNPEQTIKLDEYSLVIGVDEQYTAAVPEIKLNTISPVTEITTGGLALPEIKSITANSYKNAIKFDWSVSHMNNIETAKLEIHHKSGLTSDVIEKTIDYDVDTFISTDDEDWVGHAELANPTSGDDYYGVLTITPLSECEAPGADYTNSMESDIVTGAEIFDFEFDVTNVSSTPDSIILDYTWAKNTGTIISELKFEVVDLYAIPDETTGEVPVIYEDTFSVLPSDNGGTQGGSNSITINNDNLIAGYELYANQTYEIDGYYKKEDWSVVSGEKEYLSISEIMVDSADMDLLTVATQPKDDAFVDSVITSGDASSPLGETGESSFKFSYNFDNRTTDSAINKNVTYNSIRLYEQGVISEDTLIWESENLVDTIPGPTGSTDVFEVHNGDTQIGGIDTIDGKAIEVIPNSKFVVVPYVEYDVYGLNSREYETENRSSQKNIKIPFAATEITYNEEETFFLDNDSAQISYHFEKATAFALSDENYLEIFVNDNEGQPHDVIYNGELHDGTEGLKIYSDEIDDFWTHNTDGENDFADFLIELDGVTTEFEDHITIASTVHIENSDGSVNEREDAITITNNTNQLESPFIEAGNMGVFSRVDVLGEYWDYEIRVESNFPINNFTDVVISEVDLPNSSSADIEVLEEAQVETEFEYNVNNLYLRVDKDIVAPDAEYNDLSFLVGRYIGVDASSMHGAARAAWDGYDWFAIDGFFWLYPPKTAWEIILEIIIWILIILAILLAIALISGTSYYIFRITFSNKKWYPIVETIANEKFAVFTDYVENFGWTQKFQEYADLKEKNIKELREYALKMNIPITFDMTRNELLKTVSLLTDDEIEKFNSFTDDDIDVKNYEILDHWKVARYKKYNFWIKYKLSKLEEKGILKADDDKLETIQAQIEYIEREKAAHEEREQMYEEIKNLVADVLDTNVELTSEFSADPLNEFKKELEDKAAEEKARKEEEEAEIRAAVDAEEQARLEAEAEEQRIIDEKNAKEVKAIKTKLAFDYKKIAVNIASFNKGASKSVVGAEAAREATEKLTLERNKINKLIEIFKQREERIVKLNGEPDTYAFETLNKVDIQTELTKFEKFEQELGGMTKQALIEKAKKLKLEVKVSWSKDQLMSDILSQVKERGDFDD